MQEVVTLRERAAFIAGLVLLGLAYSGVARASSYNIVYQGQTGTQGVLATDTAGNLYVEAAPGSANEGSILELTVASGFAKAKTLYVFGNGGAADGNDPTGGVTLTAKTVILGSTSAGGINSDGVVFDLGKPHAIAFMALHAFSGSRTNPVDGATPESGLTLGLSNQYYGTTTAGGRKNAGTVFSVSGSTTNPKFRVLHSFGAAGDGINPGTGRLAVDAQGRLYGVTQKGGANGYGIVFMMQYASGAWQEQVLYSFQGNLGLFDPPGNIVLDSAGNLYGCGGKPYGSSGKGGIYRVSPPAEGQSTWTATGLYYFGTKRYDPDARSACNIAIDTSTNLIIGTSMGGGVNQQGTIFSLVPPPTGGDWTETVVHSFAAGDDGAVPTTPPLKVGSTYYGGNSTNGAIYALTP